MNTSIFEQQYAALSTANNDVLLDSNTYGIPLPAEMVMLDYYAGSIKLDFGGSPSGLGIRKLALSPDSPVHRVDRHSLRVLSSVDDSVYDEDNQWSMMVSPDGSVEIIFKYPLQTRYLKIHCSFDDRDYDLIPLSPGHPEYKTSFKNAADSIVAVFYTYEVNVRDNVGYDGIGNSMPSLFAKKQS